MITTTTAVPTARVGMDFTLVLAMAVEEQAGNQTEKAGITAMPGGGQEELAKGEGASVSSWKTMG